MKKDSTESFKELIAIVARLRDKENGCPWDLKQTHQTLIPYMIEEAHEAVDAIRNEPSKLASELGDVLLQVVLHAQIGSDEGTFDIGDVIEHLKSKLIERHPHIFGDTKVADEKEVTRNWEEIKRKSAPSTAGLLDGIPSSLPALLKSQRIGERVARIGFDWDQEGEVIRKIKEEVEELLAADSKDQPEEFGDLLFTLAQLARKLDLDSEECLQKANQKFARRFRHMESQGRELKSLSKEELQVLWRQAKSAEKD